MEGVCGGCVKGMCRFCSRGVWFLMLAVVRLPVQRLQAGAMVSIGIFISFLAYFCRRSAEKASVARED